jgi:hypothetical protein
MRAAVAKARSKARGMAGQNTPVVREGTHSICWLEAQAAAASSSNGAGLCGGGLLVAYRVQDIGAVWSGSDARCRVSGRHNEVFSQEVRT